MNRVVYEVYLGTRKIRAPAGGTIDINGNQILPYDKLKKTLWYKENERWAKWIKEMGYEIYDLGDNPGLLRNVPNRSAFYNLEKSIIFND